jgi:putative DNA primase/helicase
VRWGADGCNGCTIFSNRFASVRTRTLWKTWGAQGALACFTQSPSESLRCASPNHDTKDNVVNETQQDVVRYEIDVTSHLLHEHCDETWIAVTGWAAQHMPHPPIMLRGSQLVFLALDDDDARLRDFDSESLRLLMSRAANFYRTTKDGVVYVKAPREIATALLRYPPQDLVRLGNLTRLPENQIQLRVNRVVDVPVLSAIGSLITSPGFHPDARTYYVPDTAMGAVAQVDQDWEHEPSYNDFVHGTTMQQLAVEDAKQLLLEVLQDFPFADEASRAHALCLIIEPFVREMIGNSPTPMYAITASQPDSGKTLLADVCLGIGCGRPAVSTYTSDEDELRKRITALLMQGRSVVQFDNVKQVLDSGVLAAALTASTWEDRILGKSQLATAQIRNVWLFTSNNPTISAELTRRICPIRLTNPHPADYDFLHANLAEWAREHRAELVQASLVLALNYVRGWDLDVTPDGELEMRRRYTSRTRMLHSYPRWSEIMGGILHAAEIEGFLDNLDELHEEANVETQEAAALLADLYERIGERKMKLDELTPYIRGGQASDGALYDSLQLPAKLHAHEDEFKGKLGTWLRDNKGAVIGGYRLVKEDKRHSLWSVRKLH